MDWFEKLLGFRETGYEDTRMKLSVVDGRLRSSATSRNYAVGDLTLPSLGELRARAAGIQSPGRLRLSIVEGDVRTMHLHPENVGALFQVASQFNMLEMVGPNVTPEAGVAGYQHDRTQGPACAMAAGAATIFRNYLVPVNGAHGQTAKRQLDGLADLSKHLSQRTGVEPGALWTMRNGYALPSKEGLTIVTDYLRTVDADEMDLVRTLIRFGLQTDAEVTDGPFPGPQVSQIFCSALPVAYSGLPAADWAPFARLVLESAYEATMLAAILNVARGSSKRVLLTRLGGGAFGNDDAWIDAAMLRALRLFGDCDLNVAIVSYGRATPALRTFVERSGFASS